MKNAFHSFILGNIYMYFVIAEALIIYIFSKQRL